MTKRGQRRQTENREIGSGAERGDRHFPDRGIIARQDRFAAGGSDAGRILSGKMAHGEINGIGQTAESENSRDNVERNLGASVSHN